MCPINYDYTMNKLHELAKNWAAQFEGKAPLEVVFSTQEGLVTVNGVCLNCPLSVINGNLVTFDAEYIWIPTVSGSVFEIYLDMPFAGEAKIGHIKHICTIYSAESK